MIDISPADEMIVNAILKKHVAKCEVRAFGSRHKWTTKSYSDLDLAIVGTAKLDKNVIYALQEAFEESELSFRVDVLDWYAISDEFRQIIEQGYTVIQEKEIDNQLPAGWTVTRLGDVVELSQGLAINAKTKHLMSEHGLPLLRISDLINNVSVQFITDGLAPTQCIVKKGDVIFTRTGQVGLVFNNRTGVLHNNSFKVTPLNNTLDKNYLYWFLRQSKIHQLANSIASGSVQKDLNHGAFKSIEINIPPLEEQKKIAAILSSLDDKIELNRQTNQTLEEMAQAIFKEWFIDFNFPDENGNPYRDSGGSMIDSELGQIPASWSVGELADEFSITMGQSPAGTSYNENSEGMIFFQGRTDFGIRFPSIRLFTTEPKRIAKKFDILLSVRAPVGDINIALQDCCIGRGLAAINSEDKSYCYYKLQWLKNQFDIYNGTGTVFGAINKDQLNGLSVIIPDSEIIKLFEDVVSKIDEKIYNNHLEILNLQDSRDTLLLKLMSVKLFI